MAQSSMHLARRCAVQALYQWRMTGQAPAQIGPNFINNEQLTDKHLAYFRLLIEAIPRQIETIDRLIASHLDRAAERVDIIEQAILRLGAYELYYQPSIPVKVVLNEAIKLAKLFCAEHGYKYVNGVLDKVAQQTRNEAADAAPESATDSDATSAPVTDADADSAPASASD